MKLTKRPVAQRSPGVEISSTSPVNMWRVDPLEGVFIIALKVGRANQKERWQITGREAIAPQLTKRSRRCRKRSMRTRPPRKGSTECGPIPNL